MDRARQSRADGCAIFISYGSCTRQFLPLVYTDSTVSTHGGDHTLCDRSCFTHPAFSGKGGRLKASRVLKDPAELVLIVRGLRFDVVIALVQADCFISYS